MCQGNIGRWIMIGFITAKTLWVEREGINRVPS